MRNLTVAILLLTGLTAGCATSRPLAFHCDDFKAAALEPNAIIRSVIADQGKPIRPGDGPAMQAAQARGDGSGRDPRLFVAGGDCSQQDPLLEALLKRRGLCRLDQNLAPANAGTPRVLVLSGGGQWGAFGAGFLKELDARRTLPPFDVITGVSTGAMQSLILGDTAPGRYDRLLQEYTIKDEREIVARGPRVLAAVTGSIAGLQPLVRKIENALCSDQVIDGAKSVSDADCLLTRLASGQGATVLVGFVEAESGRLMVANVNRLAKLYGSPALQASPPGVRLRHARTCVTAAAVASSAMPVFYQQVSVTYSEGGVAKTRTLLDGGVRQSVFLPAIAERVATADALSGFSGGGAGTDVVVLRNGPTTAKFDSQANKSGNVLDKALRAYDIVVNQLEVGSIAAIRTEIPLRPVALATADGLATDACLADRNRSKRRSARMFDPDFMACLRNMGAAKASQASPWLMVAQAEQRR